MANSPDLGVPYVPSPPPAQAEVLHNEAVNMLIALQKGAISRGLNAPPGSPADGDVYIIGDTPTGAWSGKANKIAMRVGTGWLFLPGNESDGTDIPIGARHQGLRLWVAEDDALVVWSGTDWTIGLASTAYVDSAIAAAASGNGSVNVLVSGGQVRWESDYTFRVSAATYYIAGQLYSAAEQTVTLDAADGTNDRIDLIVLDDSGDVVAITGTAAAQPSEPDYDPSTQLKLSFVLVAATTTAPPGLNTEDIYLENSEWTSSTSGSGFNPDSTNNPKSGSKCIEGTSVANNAYVSLDHGATFDLADYSILTLFIRSKANWPNKRVLRVQWFDNGVARGTAATIATGYWGFNSAQTSGYQQIAIPLSTFAVPPGTPVDQLRITNSGGAIGFYIDEIGLQAFGGSVGEPPAAGLTQEQADARYLRLTGGRVTGAIEVQDDPYDSSGWNGSSEVPTKNAVRDALEALGGSGPAPFTIGCFFTTTPEADEVLLRYTFAEDVDFADDFAGSVGNIATNPDSSLVLTVSRNGSGIGTITISTGGSFTFATTGGAESFDAGDEITITAPSTPDVTAAEASFTLKGTR